MGAGWPSRSAPAWTTEVGQIAASLQQMAERPDPLPGRGAADGPPDDRLVAALAAVVAGILLFVLHEPPVDVALNTLSLAVATIPESLPIVLTFALALGARQMARRKAVVRRLSVVESLGSVDTICTDKTGTLTQNLMTLQQLYVGGSPVKVPEGMHGNPAALELLLLWDPVQRGDPRRRGRPGSPGGPGGHGAGQGGAGGRPGPGAGAQRLLRVWTSSPSAPNAR